MGLLVILTISSSVIAQSDPHQEDVDFWEKVQFGGGLALGFADGFFAATLAPSGIYNYTAHFAFGIGLNTTFNSLKNQYRSTVLGGSLLVLYMPVDILQVSVELEQLHVSKKGLNSAVQNHDYWSPALFVGAGYRQYNMVFGMRFDLLYDRQTSIYTAPWTPFVRFYFW
ncbi:MAG: alpha-ketoglutarate decarboxylase [Flavobacteriaceae bacterium]|nr:alpha-ketoglutarate decarboxylase [Flavobacteriaceae bacterium]